MKKVTIPTNEKEFSLADIYSRIELAKKTWMKEQGSNFEDYVYNTLEERKTEIVAKLLGFDNSWGR